MSTPDPPSSPARATPPRTPEQNELERRAVKAELAVLEARALASRAAEDYSKVKETEVAASRASRARAKTALKVALCALVVVGAVARGRGARNLAVEDVVRAVRRRVGDEPKRRARVEGWGATHGENVG